MLQYVVLMLRLPVPPPVLVLMLVLLLTLLLLLVLVVTLMLLLTLLLLDVTNVEPASTWPARQSSRNALIGNLMVHSAALRKGA